MDEAKVEDLTLYPTLDENIILRILQARFANGNIYVRGFPILQPFAPLNARLSLCVSLSSLLPHGSCGLVS